MGMDTSKKEKIHYGIGTSETVQYFKGTVNGTLWHNHLINIVYHNINAWFQYHA